MSLRLGETRTRNHDRSHRTRIHDSSDLSIPAPLLRNRLSCDAKSPLCTSAGRRGRRALENRRPLSRRSELKSATPQAPSPPAGPCVLRAGPVRQRAALNRLRRARNRGPVPGPGPTTPGPQAALRRLRRKRPGQEGGRGWGGGEPGPPTVTRA